MKSILKSLLIIAMMVAFLEACLYFSPSANSNALKNKPASSVSSLKEHQMNDVNKNSKIDSQSLSSGKIIKWIFIKKKTPRT